jgi:hypothetical protein
MAAFFKNLFGKDVETRTQSQETTYKFQTGEIRRKIINERVTVGNDDPKVTIYNEFSDKTGTIYLKFKQLDSDTSPVIWEFQKLSGRTTFADDEEKNEMQNVFDFIKKTDPEYAKTIDFSIPWIFYKSPLGYYAEFPGVPNSNTQKTGENITVYDSTYSVGDKNYTITLIYNTDANKDESFYNFFQQATQLNDSMKLVSQSPINFVGIDTALRKIEIMNNDQKFYVTLIQVGIQYHVVAISINSTSGFINDSEFERFHKGFGLEK